jgi:hypothetical protein
MYIMYGTLIHICIDLVFFILDKHNEILWCIYSARAVWLGYIGISIIIFTDIVVKDIASLIFWGVHVK